MNNPEIIEPCPHCGSIHLHLLPYGQILGLILSGLAGALLAGTRVKSRHPIAMVIGAVGAAAAWAAEGRDVGHQIDVTFLRRYECRSCGARFSL